jgi:hypothetical protein
LAGAVPKVALTPVSGRLRERTGAAWTGSLPGGFITVASKVTGT